MDYIFFLNFTNVSEYNILNVSKIRMDGKPMIRYRYFNNNMMMYMRV